MSIIWLVLGFFNVGPLVGMPTFDFWTIFALLAVTDDLRGITLSIARLTLAVRDGEDILEKLNLKREP